MDQLVLLGLAVGAFAASELYGMARLAMYGNSHPNPNPPPPKVPLLRSRHKLIKREKVMFEVGECRTPLGAKT